MSSLNNFKGKLQLQHAATCGNRQYVNFNSVGKAMDKQMEIMGATRIYERGEGDDDQNIEEDFEQWQENGLWPAILKALGKGDCQGKEDPEMRNAVFFVAHFTCFHQRHRWTRTCFIAQ